MNLELASFQKSINREASAYSVLKDECFFVKFQRDLLIKAKSHGVSKILDLSYSQDFIQAQKSFWSCCSLQIAQYINLYILYFFMSRQIQKSRNYQNPSGTSRVIKKT